MLVASQLPLVRIFTQENLILFYKIKAIYLNQIFPKHSLLVWNAAAPQRGTGDRHPQPTSQPTGPHSFPCDVDTVLLFPVVQGFTCINNTLLIPYFYKKM